MQNGCGIQQTADDGGGISDAGNQHVEAHAKE